MTTPIKHTPRWIVFMIDLLISLVSIVLSYFIRFEFRIGVEQMHSLEMIAPLILFVRAISFVAFRSYAGLIRYTSSKDAERIFIVVSASSVILLFVNFINYTGTQQFIIPNSILVIDFFITTIMLVGSRLFYKAVYYSIKNTDINKDNIIVVGTEQSAAALKRAIDRDTISNIRVVAFIDPYNQQEGKKIEDIDIYNTYRLDFLLQKFEVSKVIIAQKNLDPVK